jgi:hypothetical protein
MPIRQWDIDLVSKSEPTAARMTAASQKPLREDVRSCRPLFEQINVPDCGRKPSDPVMPYRKSELFADRIETMLETTTASQ